MVEVAVEFEFEVVIDVELAVEVAVVITVKVEVVVQLKLWLRSRLLWLWLMSCFFITQSHSENPWIWQRMKVPAAYNERPQSIHVVFLSLILTTEVMTVRRQCEEINTSPSHLAWPEQDERARQMCHG